MPIKVIDVYTKKPYTCNSCQQEVYYGKVTAEDGSLLTKDGKAPNGKYGKDSNVLSAAVDINNKEKIHSCYYNKVVEDIAAAEAKKGNPDAVPPKHNMVQYNLTEDLKVELKEFDELVSNAYIALYQIASRGNPGGTPKDIHIGTMGLMHDYFTYRLTKALQNSKQN